MRHIRSKNFRRQPWKNGGGETLEIAVFPANASVDNFDWRVSLAKVASEGPFSSFPNIDRTLTILDGQGIELTVDGAAHTLASGEPHAFPGDAPAAARLIDGAVTDLNVMTRRGKFMHRVSPRTLQGSIDFVVRSPTAVVYCHSGRMSVEDEIAPAFEVEAGDALLIEAQPNSLRLTASVPTQLFLVEIGPLRG